MSACQVAIARGSKIGAMKTFGHAMSVMRNSRNDRSAIASAVASIVTTSSHDKKNKIVDDVIDYQKQQFEDVLRDYDAVLGTLRGDWLERSLRILRPGSVAR